MHERIIDSVMERMLLNNNPVINEIKEQLVNPRLIRIESSDVGFFAYFDSTGFDSSGHCTKDFSVGNVYGNTCENEYAVGFELFVKGGKIYMLEGYTLSVEKWPSSDELIELV